MTTQSNPIKYISKRVKHVMSLVLGGQLYILQQVIRIIRLSIKSIKF